MADDPIEKQLGDLGDALDEARESQVRANKMLFKQAFPAAQRRPHAFDGYTRSLADRALYQLLDDILKTLRHQSEEKKHG